MQGMQGIRGLRSHSHAFMLVHKGLRPLFAAHATASGRILFAADACIGEHLLQGNKNALLAVVCRAGNTAGVWPYRECNTSTAVFRWAVKASPCCQLFVMQGTQRPDEGGCRAGIAPHLPQWPGQEGSHFPYAGYSSCWECNALTPVVRTAGKAAPLRRSFVMPGTQNVCRSGFP
jgi:hypothetical protein